MCASLKLFLLVLLSMISFPSFAGKDPVTWTVSGGFPQYVLAGRTYPVTYTFTNNLPLALVKPLVIEKKATPADEFTYEDTCTGVKVASHGSCTVTINLVPMVPGVKSVQLIVGGYDNNRVPVTALTTTSIGTNPALTPVTVVGQMNPNLTLGLASSYTFTFTNNGPTAISGVSVDVTQTSGTPSYTATASCSSAVGGNGGRCVVTGNYIPTSSTPLTQGITAVMHYSGTKSITGTVSGSVTSVSGVIPSFTGQNYFPAEMVGGKTQKIQIQYYNNTGGGITPTVSTLVLTPTAAGSFALDPPGATNNCVTGGSLPNHAACIITGTFTSNTVVSDTQALVTGQLTYTGASGSPVSLAGSTYVVPSLSPNRTITFKNSCDFPIWVSFSGGGQGSCPCPSGQTCGPKNTCFWNNPTITGGNEFLPGAERSATITNYGPSTNATLQWSGAISASLRCDTGNCLMAPCDNSNGTTNCAVGKGFVGPATLAEMTFGLNTTDNYDISVINGYHVPVTITPESHTIPNNYSCGVAGGFTASNNFGSCNWHNATTPSNAYYVVTPGGQACNVASPSSPACPTNQLCGVASTSTVGSIVQSCGYFLGYWTATEICGSLKPTAGSTLDTMLGCTTPLPASYAPYVVTGETNTYTALMLCAVPTGDVAPVFNSCYNSYGAQYASMLSMCCGCYDWWNTVPGVNSNASSCNGVTNPTWNQVMQLQLTWIKTACPSSYVYQFDDKTSGFSCSTAPPPEENNTNYRIEFCQGNSGLSQANSVWDGRKNPPAALKVLKRKSV